VAPLRAAVASCARPTGGERSIAPAHDLGSAIDSAFATYAMRSRCSLVSGVPVHVVAARLGHADPAITLRVYAHVIRSAEATAADIFAQAVKAA
jgi:integrase